MSGGLTMKKIRKLSGYKKKKITQTDETLDNIENGHAVANQSKSAFGQSFKKRFFSKKDYNRSKSLTEHTIDKTEEKSRARNSYCFDSDSVYSPPLNQVDENVFDQDERVPAAPSLSSQHPDEVELDCTESRLSVTEETNSCNNQMNLETDSLERNDNDASSEGRANECRAPNSSAPVCVLDYYQSNTVLEFKRLAKRGWYWGPLTRLEAEEKLQQLPDGSFLVRDSSDDRYLLSLSFRSFGRTLHTRIEHSGGKFSFYNDHNFQAYSSVVELIEVSIRDSQHSGVFCYSSTQAPASPTLPVRLNHPVSRLSQVRSLQYLCRFVIRQFTRIDHIEQLPLPNIVKGYVEESYF